MGLEVKVLETKAIEFNGEQREYLVVDRDIGVPASRYFVKYVLGMTIISDEVPEKFREPMVLHELLEFETFNFNKYRCFDALIQELQTVPDGERDAYIEFRRGVFEHLVRFCEDPVEEEALRSSRESGSLLMMLTSFRNSKRKTTYYHLQELRACLVHLKALK